IPVAWKRIDMNFSIARFNDQLVLDAFIRSVDVDGGLEALFFDTAPRSYSLLSTVEPMQYSDDSLFYQDVDEAKALLDEAGWTARDEDGVRVKDGERLESSMPVSTNQSVTGDQS